MNDSISEKLSILADGAKYDVSCASSGTTRKNPGDGLGNTIKAGICHSYTEDGRCISLLKILMSNNCIYDCAYCINRKTNDIKRTSFTVDEVIELTIGFYRRNYIEGLFLTSGVLRNPDYTMERLTRIAKLLRMEHRFYGYIHLKAIPGASPEIIRKAGLYADRLSVNMEIPTNENLKLLAPEKNFNKVLQPMNYIKNNILEAKTERRITRKAPKFAPGGQSTQLIIGASPERDVQILTLASVLYNHQQLKRVYYSGYLPVNQKDHRLPALNQPPLKRENRLYQADWLLRFYQFGVHEIVNEKYPDLDMEIDPKLSYALRNPQLFPVDINKADYEMILRIPGIGVLSARKIIQARKYGKLGTHHLKKIGVVLKRARYFINCNELPSNFSELQPHIIKEQILKDIRPKKKNHDQMQLPIFN